MTDNTRGALLMMASMAAFTLNDTFIKSLSGSLPLFQILFLRGVLTTLVIGAYTWHKRQLHLSIPRRDLGLVAIRTMAEIAAAFFFLEALFHMPLANVTAILQSLPLVVTLSASLFFHEPLGWRRLSAIMIGLFGVMLIVRPGAEGFNTYSIYALIAVGCVTIRDLSTRRLSPATPSLLVTFMASAGVMVFFGLAGLYGEWQPIDARDAGLIGGASLMIVGGYLFSVLVMRIGEISFVTAFRYTGIVWALLLGWVVFDDWPQPLTLVGASVVVASGVFMLLRERKLADKGR